MVAALSGHGDGSREARAPLKIGIFNWRDTAHPKAGGAEEYLVRQTQYWIAAGHSVKWYAASFAGAKPYEIVDGVEVLRRGGEFTVYAYAPLTYWGAMRDCDVLLDAENGIPFFTPLFSRRPKLLLMFHVHRHVLLAELPKPLSYIAWMLEVWAMPFVYRNVPFVAISESTCEDVRRYRYTKRPIALVHSGVDHAFLAPGPRAPSPTVLYIGRLVRYKRVRKLIEVFANVRDRIPDARLVIAGAGDELDACREEVRRQGLGGAVEFAGRVDESRKRKLLASAWVFAHPSRIEGWGISIIEAAACGTPSVAMRVKGLKDAILDGTTGVLADDWDEFRNALLYILTDAAARERLSKAALNFSMEFSWKKTAESTLNLLEHAMHADSRSLTRR